MVLQPLTKVLHTVEEVDPKEETHFLVRERVASLGALEVDLVPTSTLRTYLALLLVQEEAARGNRL